MPTHRSVTISLQSQYDAQTIPEILSPSSKKLLPIGSRIITAHIPILPASQFWISYRCPLPPPPKPGGDETRFYYFKLYVSGANVLNWGVGERDEWKGKTVFGLFDAGTDFEGRKVVEKKGLFFPGSESGVGAGGAGGAGFEIRVFRAKARKRGDTRYETFDQGGMDGQGLSLTSIGRKKKCERQRMYTYALIDPKDTPYVTFRYVFRSKEQLRQLDTAASDSDACEDVTPQHAEHIATTSSPPWKDLIQSTSSPALGGTSEVTNPLRRLSIPPRKPLNPSTSKIEPWSPVKKEVSWSFEGEPKSIEQVQSNTGRRREDQVLRTPSPFQTGRGGFGSPGTPPSQRKVASGRMFRNVVASALKRKAVTGGGGIK